MTLVAPPPQQCPAKTPPSAVAITNGVAPCSGCVKLHADIKQNVQQMMDKFDLLYMRLENLISEKEKDRMVSHEQDMSESGSDDKDVPSPTDSRASPALMQGSRKRKPTKDAVQRVSEDGPITTLPEASTVISAATSTPVSTTPSSFAESLAFPNGLMAMDPMAQQQQLLQFIVQQSIAQQHQPPASMQAGVKQEQTDPQMLMEQLQQQFKEASD